jgi:hypothetical protein
MLDKKGIDTYPEYVIILAFALQQRLGERAAMLRHPHIAFGVLR